MPVAMMGAVGVWQLSLAPPDEGGPPVEPEASRRAAERVAPEPAGRATGWPLRSQPQALREEPSGAAMSPWDQKVQEQLKIFMERTANISAESVALERKKVEEGLVKALGREVEMPQTRIEVDEQGEKWERMEYSDGTIRYFPVPQGEQGP